MGPQSGHGSQVPGERRPWPQAVGAAGGCTRAGGAKRLQAVRRQRRSDFTRVRRATGGVSARRASRTRLDWSVRRVGRDLPRRVGAVAWPSAPPPRQLAKWRVAKRGAEVASVVDQSLGVLFSRGGAPPDRGSGLIVPSGQGWWLQPWAARHSG